MPPQQPQPAQGNVSQMQQPQQMPVNNPSGQPMQSMPPAEEKKSIFKKWWFWLILVLVVLGIGVGSYFLFF